MPSTANIEPRVSESATGCPNEFIGIQNPLEGEFSRYRCEVHIRPSVDGGFVADVPSLDAAYTQGQSTEEVLERVKEVIAGVLECYLEEGDGIPWEDYEAGSPLGEGVDRHWVFVDV